MLFKKQTWTYYLVKINYIDTIMIQFLSLAYFTFFYNSINLFSRFFLPLTCGIFFRLFVSLDKKVIYLQKTANFAFLHVQSTTDLTCFLQIKIHIKRMIKMSILVCAC